MLKFLLNLFKRKPKELPENTGVIIEEISEEDYIAGDNKIKYEVVNPSNNWSKYLPANERQHSVYFDTMGCVSFSALNCVETSINRQIVNKTLSVAIRGQLEALGFIVNGKFEASDRFTAKSSGTTRRGNSLGRVWNSIKHDGLLPEKDWNYPRDQRHPVFDWNDYYKEIPQHLKDKAKKFLELFEVQYEWVSLSSDLASNEKIRKHLKQAPLQLAAPICPVWNGNKIIQPCGKTRAGHATTIYDLSSVIWDFDSYDPYHKRLALTYHTPFILKGIIKQKKNMWKTIKPKGDNRVYAEDENGNLYWVTSSRMYMAGMNKIFAEFVEVDKIDPTKVIGTFNKEY